MATTMQEMIQAVKDHARENYEKGGWDIIYECWTDVDIEVQIAGCRTTKGAIKKVGIVADLLGERRQEVQSHIF